MSLREKFERDPFDFISRNAIAIAADWTKNAMMANAGSFTDITHGQGVDLTPPTAYATFTEHEPKPHHPAIKCSAPLINMNVTDDASGLPVYVIPYRGKTAQGTKLPTGPDKAYAITTRIDGCTFTVSGDPRTPYVSHSNVNSADDKPAEMLNHIDELERMFREAEHDAGEDEPLVGTNRAHFNYWHERPEGRSSAMVNYARLAQQRVAASIATGSHTKSVSKAFSHDKYFVKLNEYSRTEIAKPTWIPINAVIGVREHGNWTFFYNTSSMLRFDVKKQKKVRSNVKSEENTRFNTWCVLTYGQIWPEKHVYTRPFYTDNYTLEGWTRI